MYKHVLDSSDLENEWITQTKATLWWTTNRAVHTLEHAAHLLLLFKSSNKQQSPARTAPLSERHRNPQPHTCRLVRTHAGFTIHRRHDLSPPRLQPQWKVKLHNWKDSSQRNPLDYSVLQAPSKQLCYALTGQATCLLSFSALNRRGQLINIAINQFTANMKGTGCL